MPHFSVYFGEEEVLWPFIFHDLLVKLQKDTSIKACIYNASIDILNEYVPYLRFWRAPSVINAVNRLVIDTDAPTEETLKLANIHVIFSPSNLYDDDDELCDFLNQLIDWRNQRSEAISSKIIFLESTAIPKSVISIYRHYIWTCLLVGGYDGAYYITDLSKDRTIGNFQVSADGKVAIDCK